MGEILIPRRTKVEKGYELLADITVGTATTNVDITGLNIGKGDEVVLVSDRVNPLGVYSNIYLYINGKTTKTNYYNQFLIGVGNTVEAGRENQPVIIGSYQGLNSSGFTRIKLTNSGYIAWQSEFQRKHPSYTPVLTNVYGTSTFAVSSITSISLSATDQTNAIGIGSRFQLYKIGGA